MQLRLNFSFILVSSLLLLQFADARAIERKMLPRPQKNIDDDSNITHRCGTTDYSESRDKQHEQVKKKEESVNMI